jgi:hypothetical protein
MEWIRVDIQLPLKYIDKSLWFYDGEIVYKGSVPFLYKKPEDMLEYLHRYNISHWMPYFPSPPKNNK